MLLLGYWMLHINKDHVAPTRRVCRQLLLASLEAQGQGGAFLEQKQGVEECVVLAHLHLLLLSLLSVRLSRSMGKSLLYSKTSQHLP